MFVLMFVLTFVRFTYTDVQPLGNHSLNLEQRLRNLENTLLNVTQELLLETDARKKLEKELASEKVLRQVMMTELVSERAVIRLLAKKVEEDRKSDNETMQQMLLLTREHNQSMERVLLDLERSRSRLNETLQSDFVHKNELANVNDTIKNTKIEILQELTTERNERNNGIGDLNHTVFSLQSAMTSINHVLVSKYTVTHS